MGYQVSHHTLVDVKCLHFLIRQFEKMLNVVYLNPGTHCWLKPLVTGCSRRAALLLIPLVADASDVNYYAIQLLYHTITVH